MPVLSDLQFARRAAWRLTADPTRCAHRRGFFEPLGVARVRKRCRRCGPTLLEAARCPSVVGSGRQGLPPVRSDQGYHTGAAHAPLEGGLMDAGDPHG